MSGHLTWRRVSCATLFKDHFSGFTFCHLQVSSGYEETLAAKCSFEKFAHSCGLSIKAYCADNGQFGEQAFRDECELQQQKITLCGVGAHHQNGVAEASVKISTLGARTLLLHAQRLWPEAITTMLWLFALLEHVCTMNHYFLDENGKSAYMKFANVDSAPEIGNQHPWGCLVYVLESKLQSDPKGLPKWEPRSRLGIYLGHSPAHAGSVALVLNPSTGHVSPQYHLVFDDEFTTVCHMREKTVPPNWRELVENSSFSSTEEQFSLADVWLREHSLDPSDPDSAPPLIAHKSETLLSAPSPSDRAPNSTTAVSKGDPDSTPIVSEGVPPVDASSSDGVSASSLSPLSKGTSISEGDSASFPQSSNSRACEGDDLSMPQFTNLETAGLRRSSRNRFKSAKVLEMDKTRETSSLSQYNFFSHFGGDKLVESLRLNNEGFSLTCDATPSSSFFAWSVDRFHRLNAHYDGTINAFSTFIFAALNDSNDTYTLKEMLKQNDIANFVEAMVKEVDDHEQRGHWICIPRSRMPKGTSTILSIWSFKHKRLPDGTIVKWKARLCCHGGMQKWGINYWETYAPLVGWASVRLLLIIAAINKIPTKSIDFVLAFPQAKLDVPVYMELPFGFTPESGNRKGMVLKVVKNLYGLKNAPLNWFEMLQQSLRDRGFLPSAVDPCVFIRNNCIILIYVDDCIIISKEEKVIDDFVTSMINGKENFILTDDGDLARFLGVEIGYKSDGTIHMTQPHLIQRILDLCGVKQSEVNQRDTPVSKPLLHEDLEGLERKHSWNYRSAVGMLGYLSGTSRAELAIAIHQCARFNNFPRLSHERAIIRIFRYLLSSPNKGMIYKPDRFLGLQCFVDADFAGGWIQVDADNPTNLLSRTGYVIMYAGCPILWCSKLQTEIALSTTEAEYIALSQAVREVLPLMQLLRELSPIFHINKRKPELFCEVFEDNRSTIAVAESKKYTPRTKHIALKYHYFRRYVHDGTLKIHHIDTKEQIADIFTKP